MSNQSQQIFSLKLFLTQNMLFFISYPISFLIQFNSTRTFEILNFFPTQNLSLFVEFFCSTQPCRIFVILIFLLFKFKTYFVSKLSTDSIQPNIFNFLIFSTQIFHFCSILCSTQFNSSQYFSFFIFSIEHFPFQKFFDQPNIFSFKIFFN